MRRISVLVHKGDGTHGCGPGEDDHLLFESKLTFEVLHSFTNPRHRRESWIDSVKGCASDPEVAEYEPVRFERGPAFRRESNGAERIGLRERETERHGLRVGIR